jgi:hypothetical protein
MSKYSKLCSDKLVLLKYVIGGDILPPIMRRIAKKMIQLIGYAPFKLRKMS